MFKKMSSISDKEGHNFITVVIKIFVGYFLREKKGKEWQNGNNQ